MNMRYICMNRIPFHITFKDGSLLRSSKCESKDSEKFYKFIKTPQHWYYITMRQFWGNCSTFWNCIKIAVVLKELSQSCQPLVDPFRTFSWKVQFLQDFQGFLQDSLVGVSFHQPSTDLPTLLNLKGIFFEVLYILQVQLKTNGDIILHIGVAKTIQGVIFGFFLEWNVQGHCAHLSLLKY